MDSNLADANDSHLSPEQKRIKDLINGPGDIEWRYEMRWKCQEILPNLFLGPLVVSKDKDALLNNGITHIVCIRDAKEAFSVKPRFPEQFVYATFDVEDNEDQNIIRVFPQIKSFIDDAIQNKNGRVLVHCNGGISLSPTFCVMYVMQYYNLAWEDALHLVQNRRYCISPNGGFLVQLKEYEAIYRASHAVTRFNHYPPSAPAFDPTGQQHLAPVGQRRKRDDEDDDDEFERSEDRKRATLDDTETVVRIGAPTLDANAMDMS
ncbi:protein-tyrosine phosphatase-like protein [Flagelloscypha sp. PMI_526]|nr:protein-tyrosine phosphatase-like protein [Flagelloscypha sp. PMI_526]